MVLQWSECGEEEGDQDLQVRGQLNRGGGGGWGEGGIGGGRGMRVWEVRREIHFFRHPVRKTITCVEKKKKHNTSSFTISGKRI